MIDPQDVRITSYLPQSGFGAGGMTVGMSTSGMIVHHIPTGLGVSCDSERSQYANKERALKLLKSLILATEQQEEFQRVANIPDKVKMIKDVRSAVGCSLREAKDAVDRMGTFEDALSYLLTSVPVVAVQPGYCNSPGGCVCGGDLQSIREGCYHWQK